jgi:hypothetical protein
MLKVFGKRSGQWQVGLMQRRCRDKSKSFYGTTIKSSFACGFQPLR